MPPALNFEEYMPTVIRDRPDKNSAEAILYGSKYLVHKSADWWYEMLLNELERQLEEKKGRVKDPQFAAFVLKKRPGILNAREQPVNSVDQMRDIWTLKECVKISAAMKMVRRDQKESEMWCRMHGTDEYIRRRMADGISEGAWKSATASRNPQIEFDSVRALYDDDEGRAEAVAEQYAMDLERYREEQRRFAEQKRRYDEMIEAGDFHPEDVLEDGAEEGPSDTSVGGGWPDGAADPVDTIPIYRGAARDAGSDEDGACDAADPDSDEFWDDAEESEGPATVPVYPDWLTGCRRDRAVGLLVGMTDPAHVLLTALEGCS